MSKNKMSKPNNESHKPEADRIPSQAEITRFMQGAGAALDRVNRAFGDEVTIKSFMQPLSIIREVDDELEEHLTKGACGPYTIEFTDSTEMPVQHETLICGCIHRAVAEANLRCQGDPEIELLAIRPATRDEISTAAAYALKELGLFIDAERERITRDTQAVSEPQAASVR